jgi:hypothetical protein
MTAAAKVWGSGQAAWWHDRCAAQQDAPLAGLERQSAQTDFFHSWFVR